MKFLNTLWNWWHRDTLNATRRAAIRANLHGNWAAGTQYLLEWQRLKREV